MPTDYRIPLQARGLTVDDVLSAQKGFDEVRQRQQARRDQRLVEDTLKATEGDLDRTYAELQKLGRIDLVNHVQAQMAETRTKTNTAMTGFLNNLRTQMEGMTDLAGSIKDEASYRHAWQLAHDTYGPEQAAWLGDPNTYDPGRVAAVSAGGTPIKDQIAAVEKMREWLEGAPGRAKTTVRDLAEVFWTADDQADLDNMRSVAALSGVPAAVLDSMPSVWTPETKAQLQSMALGVEGTAKEARAESAELRAGEKHLQDIADATLERDMTPREFDLRRQEAALNRDREARLAADAEARRTPSGTLPTEDTVAIRNARQWRRDRIDELNEERRAASGVPRIDPQTGRMTTGQGMSDEEYQRRLDEIEDLYLESLGQARVTPPPSGGAGTGFTPVPGAVAGAVTPPAAAASAPPQGGIDPATGITWAPSDPARQSSVPRGPRPASAPATQPTESAIRSVLTTAGVAATDEDVRRFAQYRDYIKEVLRFYGKDDSDQSVAKLLANKQNRDQLGIK